MSCKTGRNVRAWPLPGNEKSTTVGSMTVYAARRRRMDRFGGRMPFVAGRGSFIDAMDEAAVLKPWSTARVP